MVGPKEILLGLNPQSTPVDSAPGDLEGVRSYNVAITVRTTSIKFGDDEPYSLRVSETPGLARLVFQLAWVVQTLRSVFS